jgi:hypothetical protein
MTPNKKMIGISLVLVGLAAAFRKKPALPSASTPASASGGVPPQRFSMLSEVQQQRVNGFRQAWDADGIPLDLQLALIANAMEETRIKLGLRSAVGLADDKKGGSWTAFQMLRPNVENAASELGISFNDIVPPSEPTGASVDRFARNQARAAVVVARALGHRWNSQDPEMSAFDLFTRWAAGPAWPAERVLASDTGRLVLHGELPSPSDLQDAVAALRHVGATIAPGALEKLAHFRNLREEAST